MKLATVYPSPVAAYGRLVTMAETVLARAEGKVVIGNVSNPMEKLTVGGDAAFGGAWDMQGNRVANLADPTDPQDVATKAYVDRAFEPPPPPATTSPPPGSTPSQPSGTLQQCQWSTGAWGACSGGQQTRTVTLTNPPEGTNCQGGTKPADTQACEAAPPASAGLPAGASCNLSAQCQLPLKCCKSIGALTFECMAVDGVQLALCH